MYDNTPLTPASKPNNDQRTLLIILGIFLVILCLGIGLAVSVFFIFQNYQEVANAQATAAVATQVRALELAQITQQAEATATAQAQATLQAQSTAQAAARATAIAQFDLFEPFNDNARGWRAGEEDNDYWQGNIVIQDGLYKWNIATAKQGFIAWGDPLDSPAARDFDLYVDARLASGDTNQVCYGLVYFTNRDTLDDGALTFSVCDTQDFSIDFFTAETNWQTLQDWTAFDAIRPGEWNTLSVTRRGAEYVFYINDRMAASVNESRMDAGYLSMFVTVYEAAYAGEIWFDNFALQPR
ncbi:MAG: hypothetical protein WHV44_00020 [Anaerolineales bacterium]